LGVQRLDRLALGYFVVQLLLEFIKNFVGSLEGEAPFKFANLAVIATRDAIA
jgi:hypothetical protein